MAIEVVGRSAEAKSGEKNSLPRRPTLLTAAAEAERYLGLNLK
jgi:hypothetical protein